MSKTPREPNGPRGYPASWDAQPVGKPSQRAYNAAMSYIESHPVTPVDLHQDWTGGFAYEPWTLVPGLPEARTYSPDSEMEDADLLVQIGVAE